MMLNERHANLMWTVWRWTRNLVVEGLLVGTILFALLAPFSLILLHEYQRFSPIQKYWFLTYWRSEFSRQEQSVYRLLLVEDADHQRWIAGPENVVPGTTLNADGKEIPFVLSTAREREGARLLLEPPTLAPNAYLYESLRDQIYGGQSIMEMGEVGLVFGWKLVLLTCLYWFVRWLYLLFERFVLRPLRDDHPQHTYISQADWLAATATERGGEGSSDEN